MNRLMKEERKIYEEWERNSAELCYREDGYTYLMAALRRGLEIAIELNDFDEIRKLLEEK